MPSCTPPAVDQAVLYGEAHVYYNAVVTTIYPGTNSADLTVSVDGGSPFTRTNVPYAQTLHNNCWSCADAGTDGSWTFGSDTRLKDPA
jgi:hypothetical protein